MQATTQNNNKHTQLHPYVHILCKYPYIEDMYKNQVTPSFRFHFLVFLFSFSFLFAFSFPFFKLAALQAALFFSSTWRMRYIWQRQLYEFTTKKQTQCKRCKQYAKCEMLKQLNCCTQFGIHFLNNQQQIEVAFCACATRTRKPKIPKKKKNKHKIPKTKTKNQ